jgi:hypothetical protein
LKRHSLPILQFLPRPEWGWGPQAIKPG